MSRSFSAMTSAAVAIVVATQACTTETTEVSNHPATPGDTTPPAIASVIAAAHTCALTPSGAVYCWGYLAVGSTQSGLTPIVTPTPVSAGTTAVFQRVFVSKVEDITCALAIGGAAYCWGENHNGQLGDGTTSDRSTPAVVTGGLAFADLAIGDGHTCGVTTTGAAYCWGFSANGAFGDGSTGVHLEPTPAAAGLSFQSIVAGADYTCGLTTAGAAYCWGLGNSGQLGDGRSQTTRTPVAVSGGLTFKSIAGGGHTVCGLTAAGRAYCWGDDFYGTVGDGSSGTIDGTVKRGSPVPVSGDLAFQSLSAGYETMCGVSDSGAGYCWGYNFGAIGDGSTDHRSTPTAVAGGVKFLSISSGTGYTCGVATGFAVCCWGDNSDGGLGDGTVVSRTTPAQIRWR